MKRIDEADPSPIEKGNARSILDWLKKYPVPESSSRPAKQIDADIEEERRSWD